MRLIAPFVALLLGTSSAVAAYDGPLVENPLLADQVQPAGDHLL